LGEPGGPLYYKEVLTRFYLEFFYPHDSEHECDRTIGSFSHQKRDHPRAAEPASGLASLSFRHSWHPMGRPEYRPLASQPHHEVPAIATSLASPQAPPTASNSSARALSATGPAPASA
ncbi:hypothetical protein EMIHUDRAFT_369214, partial [Emiliania huxleyi CCMP1516]|uniref:Uncharacterized protein n=2 Tax=Emiliania huxleyi TaxID=2903 RepID=A0A0D3J9R3_EMIH1